MSDAPQKKIETRSPSVTLIVTLTMVGLTLGGILAIFAAPLRALVAR